MSSLGSWGRGINEAATVYVRTAHGRNFYPRGTTAHIRADTSRRILRLLLGPEGTNPRGLTLELAQVIEFGASDPAGPDHFDLVNHRRMQREDPLHAMTEGDLANGESGMAGRSPRSEEHTSELQSRPHLVCRLLLEKKK